MPVQPNHARQQRRACNKLWLIPVPWLDWLVCWLGGLLGWQVGNLVGCVAGWLAGWLTGWQAG